MKQTPEAKAVQFYGATGTIEPSEPDTAAGLDGTGAGFDATGAASDGSDVTGAASDGSDATGAVSDGSDATGAEPDWAALGGSDTGPVVGTSGTPAGLGKPGGGITGPGPNGKPIPPKTLLRKLFIMFWISLGFTWPNGKPKAGGPKAGRPKAGGPKAGRPKAGGPNLDGPNIEGPEIGAGGGPLNPPWKPLLEPPLNLPPLEPLSLIVGKSSKLDGK